MDKTSELQVVSEGKSCQALQKHVILEMKILGDKFSRIAEGEKNPEKAKTPFYMALKAYELALKTEKQLKSDLKRNSRPNLELEFLAGILFATQRSEVWRSYLDFCSAKELTPLRKGDFFMLLEDSGFRIKTLSGNKVVTPPRGGVKLLK